MSSYLKHIEYHVDYMYLKKIPSRYYQNLLTILKTLKGFLRSKEKDIFSRKGISGRLSQPIHF